MLRNVPAISPHRPSALAAPGAPVPAAAQVNGFFQEITQPCFLLEMAAAGMGYRLGRLLGGGLARGSRAGAATRWGISRATALLAEAGAFSATALALNPTPAGSPPLEFKEIFRSSLLMFSSLRAARKIFGGRAAAEALAAAYGGVLGNHLLQQKLLHWERPHDSWMSLARHGLSETLVFYAGAYVAGRFLAKPLAPLERALNLSIRKVELPPFRGPAWQAAGVPPSLPPLRFKPSPARVERSHMISFSEGGDAPRKPTGTFLRPLDADKINPFELDHPLEFSRRATRPKYQFAQRLAQGDMEFIWKGTDPLEPHLEFFLKVLNQVARNSGLQHPRTLRFLTVSPGPTQSYALVKLSPEEPFIRWDKAPVAVNAPPPPSPRGIGRVALVSMSVPVPRSPSRFPQAEAVIRETVHTLRSRKDTLPFPPPLEVKAPAPSTSRAKPELTIPSPQELWHEVKAFIDRSNDPHAVPESGETKIREFFYLPERRLSSTDIAQMETLLAYIPDGTILKIHDLTGQSTWEIWTEFGELRFLKNPLPASKKP